ncbi:MAG: tetratricopeptide repeat protein [Candidatus Cloacimonadales bacterium]|nr:tetratricopeptide repeat protein [Candidatus Cloacimonadales bacterium]
MYRKSGLILFVILFGIFGILNAEKSLERMANEAGVEGETLYNSGKYIDAAKAFETAISKLKEAVKEEGIPLDNEKISRWWEYAFNGYFRGNDFENSLRILDERLKLQPCNFDLINYKAIILDKHLHRTVEAIEVLKKYDEQNRNFNVDKKIAGYYVDLDDKENALAWFIKAYELKKDSKVIKNIATLYVQLGRNAEAVQAYEDFIQTNPKESVLVQTYKNMGKLYEDMGNYSQANTYYEKSLALKYDSTINLLLIVNYYDRDDFTKCLEKINQMLKNNSGNADAIYYRAMVKYNQDDKVGAKADFQKIINSKYSSSAKKFIESINSEL